MSSFLAIGRPMIDYFIELKDNIFLHENNYEIGKVNYLKQKPEEILKMLKPYKPRKYYGGSEGNTASLMSILGANSQLVACVGTDENGKEYEEILKENGVECHFQHSHKCTPYIFNFKVKNDVTNVCNYGSSDDLVFDEDTKTLIEKCDIFNTSIYSFIGNSYENMLEIVDYASNFSIIALNLSGTKIMDNRLLEKVIRKANIIFSNESEAKKISGTENVDSATEYLNGFSDIVVVTLGKNGSVIKNKGKNIQIAPFETEQINHVGAGDSYIAGFLSAMLADKQIEERSKQIINGLKLKTVAEEHKTDIVSMYDFSFKQCSYNNTNFRIANLKEYDILLNLPVLKLHSHCFYTAANKNLYGLIYHFDKNNLHAEAEKNEFNFLEFIEHIPDFIAPKILTMLDASIIQDTQERVWGAQKTFNINRELICGSNT
ncbi:MAG: DUF362 domain-containing protein, partial [Candidatus Thermoplasmatota archaeon]|nr:DUF362 domain-containing protein [Candidatus Thermoplasmatota archaeon]